MSRTRRNFTAQFKAKLVLEVLKGEKDINTIATENNIQPNLLRNWKKEFLDNASVVFDDKREENIKEKLASINRTSIYYIGTPVSDEELECKRIIDRLHTDNPTWGARQMSSQLKQRGYKIGRRKACRYMDEMGINPVYPKPNLSKRLKQAQVVPYLLRNAVIDLPNQAWSIDITYIPMKHGFLYLTAIIDWHSRCIVGWELDDTLDTRACIEACEKAFKVAKPEILNSDQGCQFTSQKYKDFLKENKNTHEFEFMEVLKMDKDKLKIEENEHGQKQENYMALGMCFGVMAGSVAMAILAMYGQIAWGGMCIGLGLILGMLIGMAIPKKK